MTGSPPLLRRVPFLHRHVHPFVHHLVHNKHVACFHRLATTNKAASTWVCGYLLESCLQLLDTYSNVDHVVTLFLGFWGKFCPYWLHRFTVYRQCRRAPTDLHPLQRWLYFPVFIFLLLILAILMDVSGMSLRFWFPFPQGLVMMSIFSYVCCPSVDHLWWNDYSNPLLTFNRIICLKL